MTRLGWITGRVGQPVAVCDPSWVKLTETARFTALQIVTADGQRFWAETGHKVKGGGPYGPKLLPPDAPEVRRVLQLKAFSEVDSAIHEQMRLGRNSRNHVPTIVNALSEAREAIGEALATIGALGAPEAAGDDAVPIPGALADGASAAAIRVFGDIAGEAALGQSETRRALFTALAVHEHLLREAMGTEIRKRAEPPRLGGTAYWNGLNDAARIVEGRPLDE